MNASKQQTALTGSNTGLSEARCECGQLVAKLGIGSLELKCKRCKRLVSIPFSSLSHSEVTVTLCSTPPSSGTMS
jgi:phage FluMu protein Com